MPNRNRSARIKNVERHISSRLQQEPLFVLQDEKRFPGLSIENEDRRTRDPVARHAGQWRRTFNLNKKIRSLRR